MKTSRNQLLASLAADDLVRLEPHFRPFRFEVQGSIERPNQRFRHVLFPLSGLLSVISEDGGAQIEVAMIGRDGMTGSSLLLGPEASPFACRVQIAGEAAAIEVSEFERALAERVSLRDHFLKYVYALVAQMGQNVLANGRRTIEQRLARWLLLSQDRVGGNELPLTHELLSTTLGVRRPGVTVALQILEGQGAIRNVRGLVLIVKRGKLEEIAGKIGAAERESGPAAVPAQVQPLSRAVGPSPDVDGASPGPGLRDMWSGEPLMKGPLRGRRILVVEDEYVMAEDIRTNLERAGAAVLGPAPTVREALRLLTSQAHVDGAVLDVNLAGEMVYPVADRLRQRGVPFLFATGYDQRTLPSQYASVPYRAKPLDIRELVRTLAAQPATR
jgi:CRP-like cAMP-binding protein/CheY-like chemotaxis protein